MTSAHAGVFRPQARTDQGDPLAIGAILSALGAASVVVTSAFYVISPSAVAGPVQPLVLSAAMSGAVRGAATLHIAGTVGIFGDLIWAAAAMLIAQEFGRRGSGVAAVGWIAIFLSIVIFTLVDGMTGYVFPPLAAANNAAAFEGFKRLWDMLFLLGTACYGAGAVGAFAAEIYSARPTVNRLLACAVVLAGLVGLTGALAGFAGFTGLPTDKIAGASIGLGSALLVPASLQMARAAFRSGPG
jgi:hypothetical protein